MPLINKNVGGLAKLPLYTGSYTIYGDSKRGWIEMLTSGILTINYGLSRKKLDIYLLETGERGEDSVVALYGSGYTIGSGGKGGDWKEVYNAALQGSYSVIIGSITSIGAHTTSGMSNGSDGGIGASQRGTLDIDLIDGQDGRQPFSGHNPLSGGYAQYPLGAGGGAGTDRYVAPPSHVRNGYGGYYGGSQNENGRGAANTGAGGNGGTPTEFPEGYTIATAYGAQGGSGIAILRWGYDS